MKRKYPLKKKKKEHILYWNILVRGFLRIQPSISTSVFKKRRKGKEKKKHCNEM